MALGVQLMLCDDLEGCDGVEWKARGWRYNVYTQLIHVVVQQKLTQNRNYTPIKKKIHSECLP